MAELARKTALQKQRRQISSVRLRAPAADQARVQALQQRYGNGAVSAALEQEAVTSEVNSSEPLYSSYSEVASSEALASYSEAPSTSAASSEPLASYAEPAQVVTPASTVAPVSAAPVAEQKPKEAPAEPREQTWTEQLIEGLLEKIGPFGAQLAGLLRRGGEVIDRVLADPAQFFVNLADAVGLGFSQFADHAVDNLKQGLFEWLFGAVGSQIRLPEKWDLAGVFQFAAELLGLTYQNIRRHLVKEAGADLVEKIESGVEKLIVITRLVKRVIAGDWEALKEEIVQYAGEVKERALEAIRGELITELVKKGIETLILSLNPAGLLGQGLRAAYNGIRFLMAKFEQIVQFANGIFEGIDQISRGMLKPAADLVEQSLKRAVPLVLDFVARLLGLNLAEKIKAAIDKIREPVDNALAKLAKALVAQARKLMAAVVGKVRGAVEKVREWWRARVEVKTEDGETHHLQFSGSASDANLIVASDPEEYGAYLSRTKQAAKALSGVKRDQANKAIDAASALWKEVLAKKKRLKSTDTTQAIVDDLNQLAQATEKVADLLAGTGELPPSVITYGEVTGEGGGLRVEATILTKNHPEGSPPADAAAIWRQVQRRNVAGRTIWVQGHLLNHNLGGAGRAYNLTPLSGTGSTHFGSGLNSNKAHELGVERHIKDEVAKGAVYYYEIVAHYGGHPERLGTKVVRAARNKSKGKERQELDAELDLRLYEEQHVATDLSVDAYPLVAKDGKWVRDTKGKRIQIPIPNPLPDDAGKREKLANRDVPQATTTRIDAIAQEEK